MFTLTAGYPDQVTVSQLTEAGVRRDFIHTLGAVHATDSRYECDRCQSRNLGTHIYRDPHGLWVWHPQCFADVLAERRAKGEWLVKSVGWSLPQ